MTQHFLVVGLEARRELEVRQLRERWTVRTPLGWAIGGMATAVAVYLAFNAGGPGARGVPALTLAQPRTKRSLSA